MFPMFQFPSLFTRFFLNHKNKRTLRGKTRSGTGTLVFDDHPQKTDSIPPQFTPPTEKQTGRYCIKSSIDLVYNNNNERWYYIYGYDDNLSIQERVRNICNAYQQDDPEHLRCDNDKLVFLGPRKQCNGQVHILDIPKDHLYTF